MKNRALIFLFLLFSYSPLFALWPTDGDQYVTGNYGTYEDGFHDAIDILGDGGTTKCVAIARMQLINVDKQRNAYNADFYLPNENIYVAFSHIRKLLPSEEGYIDFDDPYVIGSTIQSGQSFAVIATTYDAGTTFAHAHFQVYTQYPIWHPSAINPLTSGLVAPSDPGGAYPVIGPVYFKRDNVYITSGNPSFPNIWGKIEVISQITDFMGHNEDNPGNQIDTDTFHGVGQRYHGITSTPYKVEYSILNSLGNEVKPPESYEFSGNPDDAKMATLYEHDKGVDAHPDPNQLLPYNYVFNLTNAIDDRYWNTKLGAGQAWNGIEAKINGVGANSPFRAEYPEGEYKIRIAAWDVEKSTEIFTHLVVDNFRPYLEQLEIINSSGGDVYRRQWSFDGSSLTVSGAGNITLGADAYAARLRFSEPVADVTLTIGTSTPVQVTADTSGDKQNFTVEIPAAILAGLIDGEHFLTIQARDLAGNYILSVSPDRKVIVPSSELTRDATGQMRGNEGGDLGDVSVLTVDRTSPLITVLDNNGIVVEGGVSDGADGIWIAVDDFGPDYQPLYGSGPARLEIYRGDPAAAGVLLSSNTQSFDGGYLYTYADTGMGWLAGLPEDLITAKACDRVGNCSTAGFIIRRPPHASLAAGGDPLYLDAWGVMTSTPSTLKRDFLLSSYDGNSGIAAIKITGPASGLPDLIFSPVEASTGTVFSLSIPGDYLASVVDGQGTRTELPFNFSGITIHVSTPDSVGNVHYSSDYSVPGTADATLKLNLHADNGLERAEFLDADGNLLRTESLNGLDATVVLTTGPLSFNWQWPGAGISRITARVYDKRKNILTEMMDTGFGHGSFELRVPEYFEGSRQSQIIDLAESNRLLNGGLAGNYYIGLDTGGVLAALPDRSLAVAGTLVPSGPPDGGAIPTGELADVTVKFRTGDSPDLSDASEIILTAGKIYLAESGGSYYETPVRSPAHIALQRYGQLIVETVRIPHTGRIVRTEDGQIRYYDVSTISIGRNIHYSALTFPQRYQEYEAAISSSDIPVYFGDNVALQFRLPQTTGRIRLSVGGYSPPLGSISIPQNTAYDFQGSAFNGSARIIFKVDTSALSLAQAAALKLIRIEDVPWRYTEVPATISGGTVYADVTSLGRFMVTAPAYTTPHMAVSAETINGAPRLELTSNSPLVTYEKISADSIYSGQLASLLNSRNQASAGDIYFLGPENMVFDPAATIKMRYDKAQLESAGLWPMIYEISADGGYVSRIPSMNWNQSAGEITALVPRLHSLFGVIVSSQFPPKNDTIAPVTTLGYYNTPVFAAAGKLYISSGALIGLAAFDAPSNSSPKATYHFKDALPDFNCRKTSKDPTKPEGSCHNPVYLSTFTMGEGRHTLAYFSVDNAGNYESVKSTIVYVDGTPPVSEIRVGTITVPAGGSVYITEADSVTISALDPEINLAASGVKAVYRLVDIAPEECESANPPAACAAAEYAGPFSLQAGSHTVYYGAVDNVGNRAEGRSVTVSVERAVRVNFYPAAKSIDSVLWQWNPVEGATGYQVFSSTGGAVSSLLSAGTSVYIQAGLSPNAEYSAFLKAYTVSRVHVSAVSHAVTHANIPISIESFTSGQSASVVIGQSGFYSNSPSAGTAGLSLPEGVTLDAGGNLWVADRFNHRVLRFSPPFTTGMSANLSIGQTNLYLNLAPAFRSPDSLSQPESLAFDKHGNLWVADGYSGYNRVLRFSPPFTTGMSANLVIGAPDFYSYYSFIPTAQNFSNSYLHVGVDSANAVWVSDGGNNRVLRFSPPFTNGMSADLVLGQSGFISNTAVYRPATNSGLATPGGIAFDGGDNLWVTDVFNNRVLKFEKPFVNGQAASLVIGQADFDSPRQYSPVSPAQNNLDRPASVTFDALGNLYAFDFGSNRVLRFSPPFLNNMNADTVIGQPNFTSRISATTPNTFQNPWMGDVEVSGFILADTHGRMWVSDNRNNRVLSFEAGKVQAFSRIGVSSFRAQWDGNFNPAQTIYNAEISKSEDFSADIVASGDISALEYTFTGISGDSKYYVRVKAKNIAGVDSAYGFLGVVVTKPDIPTGFTGIVQSSNSIQWSWNTTGGVSNYQLFNSTGLEVSPVLPAGTTYYIQTGLLPNNIYSNFLRVSNESGMAESSLAEQMTFAALPGLPEIFSNGQEADYVIGQPDFTSSLLGPSANRLNFAQGISKDVNGNLWVLDNCRVLQFAPPFSTNMSANIVLGQSDFSSSTCGVGRNKFAYPYPPGMMTFDSGNRLWVSDTANNRVLMFNPPFSNGMDADLVLGQSDFNSQGYGSGMNRLNQPKGLSFDPDGRLWLVDSGNHRVLRYLPPFINGMSAELSVGGYSVTPTQKNLKFPSDVKADTLGNIWVADTANRRVLGFQSPFANGMNASVVIGQSGFTTANGIVSQKNVGRSATSIELDKYGNLYSVDTDANRVIVFKPPFSSGMNASAVLGQVNFNYAAGSVSRSGLLGPNVASAYDGLTLWVSDAAHRVLGYNAKLPFINTSSTSATVRWYNTDNPPNTEYKAEISPDASFPAVLAESPWVASSTYTFSNLTPGSTYYARLRARNLNNIESGPIYLGYTRTMDKEKLFSRSASAIDGNPEIAMNAGIQTTVVQVATGATGTLIYLGAAATQGLSLVSNMYEIGPEGVYEPAATLTFYYSAAALAAAGLDENEAAVYEHISGSGWVKLPNQILDTVNKTITVPVTRIASLFGIFGVVQDKTGPITELNSNHLTTDDAGRSYINLKSSVTFTAYDPVVYGTSTGVAYTEYRVDPGTATSFSFYAFPFMLDEGCHSIEYRSRDNAGNYGVSTTSLLCVDGVPAVSSASISGLLGKDGWYISSASIILTSIDNLSDVAGLFYSVDASSFALYSSSFSVSGEGVHLLKYYSVDRVGNKETEKELAFKLDLNAPLVGTVSGPDANSYGWNNTTVSVVFSGTDTISGMAYCEPVKVVDLEGSSQTISGYCSDYAGWSSTATLTVNIDTTVPAMDYLLSPLANAGGWNSGTVRVLFRGSDTLSGVVECSSTTMAGESKEQKVTGWCRDLAGNIAYATATLNVDFTAPLVSAVQVPERNASGWNNGPVEISFAGIDSLSGIAYCEPGKTAAIAGASQTVTGYCTDYAGLSSTATYLVNIDTSAPLLTYSRTQANTDGWNNSDVLVGFECLDDLSGMASCPNAVTYSEEGINISTSVRAWDLAGNYQNVVVSGINIDRNTPISTATISGTYRNGWYSPSVLVVLSSTDTLSGVKRIFYRLEGPGVSSLEKIYTVPLEFSTDGTFKLYYAAVDAAGNREIEKTVEFSIDATTPLVEHTLSPVPNSRDWNNTVVQVVFSGTDTVSGIELCSSETASAEGATQKIAGWCRDLAGNIGYSTATLNIDQTSPIVTISSPAAGQIFVATRGRIYVGFGVQDNLDPAPGFGAFLVQTEDSGSPRGVRPTVISVTNDQAIEPLDIDDGIWRLAVSATDFADNTRSLSGDTFEVVHDVLAPRTGQRMAGGASLTDGATTYITGETVLKFSSADDLVLAEDGIGLGVRKQTIRLKTSGSIVKELAFENSEPKQGVVFNSTFTLSSTSGLADGLYSLAYYAEDILGNIEAEKIFILGLDNAAPVTAAELTGTPGENGWHISSVSVKLTASDALSGVADIYYQSEFNGQKSELRSYTEPFTVSAEGLYKVYFYAKDRLGNTEAEKTIAFKIDRTNPLISAERTPLANIYGWNNTAVTVNYLCTDGLSGVKSCPPAAVLAAEGMNQSASGEAVDHAGNSSSVTINGINIDKTSPVSAYRVEGIVYNAGDGKTYLSPASKLSLSAADPVSGGAASDVDVVEYYIDSAPFIVYTSSFSLSEGIRSVYYRSRDKAENEETGKSVELHIDGTNPVTSFNISGTPYLVDGTYYINSLGAISFAAVDPLAEGVASGALITKYRLDGGVWQIYTTSITIPAEGLHKLEYYSLDNVQNAETLRTLTIIVDNTAPAATLSVGQPVFEVFGLKIMTPETPVTLAASDPGTAGPASGVRSIYYELTDANGSGSGVRNYTEPFSTGREGVFTVSYWSADNAGNIGTPLAAKLRVSSLRSDALDAVDGLEMTGSADIAGTVRSNATVSLGGNARILGDVYASTISISGKAQLTGQQHSGAATLVPVPLDMPEIVEIASNTNSNSLVPTKYLVNGRLVIPAKDELTLSTGAYYFSGIDLGGGARVGVNGKVDILVAGDISINGGASLNAAGSSSRLNIFLSTESALTFTGGGSLAAYVYAPHSQLKLAGNTLLGGHYFVKHAIISGAGNILQAGEALPVTAASPGGGPKTKTAVMSSGSFGILAGPDPAFRLGEVYVFPNPSKGGEAPVFHIETGLADSVTINIYTISGRAAHEHTLTGLPAELDDGNGLSYAYEYAWRGHIPSGVYLYYIETQKAGQTLKKTGKFAVIR